ncbi:phosphatase PAP2 family protein [Hespellia stercorisuis]|uniref:Undecaprenyl-diphosphatase n=1 Tax=Hespellia stercorisuis DSM 15480 TaxID=1121950 RepID=A0A1M6JLG0_9FIRM|nr:phosphatase PAP2 family protein [Hespellia stercorisuis]SHJ47541.1 undecaprenyl-diphosphatase [Hespellia stercorisuis DSM 15480]
MQWLMELDGNILLWIQDYIRHDFMDGFWKAITALGNAGILWIALTILLLCIPRTRQIGVACALSLIIEALLVNVVLKNLVARVRPYEVIEGLQILIAKPHDWSFPSGHSAASFATAMVCLKMAPKKYGVPVVILASMIAFSRLYVGVHYPTDVVAGILIGCGSTWIACRIVQTWMTGREKEKCKSE